MKTLQHLSAVIIITIIMGLIYASVQQTYRSDANDPQTQIVHDWKEHLQNRKAFALDDSVDLEKSLAVFQETFDDKGNPLQSTGFLNGKLPQLPKGVLDFVKTHDEEWVTWQPQRNVRMAMGVIRVDAAPVKFLAVGRSLKEVEERISRLTTMVALSWALCIAIVLINWLVSYSQFRKRLETNA